MCHTVIECVCLSERDSACVYQREIVCIRMSICVSERYRMCMCVSESERLCVCQRGIECMSERER